MSDEGLGPLPFGSEVPDAREDVPAFSAVCEVGGSELLIDRVLTQSTKVGCITKSWHDGGYTGTPEHDEIQLGPK